MENAARQMVMLETVETLHLNGYGLARTRYEWRRLDNNYSLHLTSVTKQDNEQWNREVKLLC